MNGKKAWKFGCTHTHTHIFYENDYFASNFILLWLWVLRGGELRSYFASRRATNGWLVVIPLQFYENLLRCLLTFFHSNKICCYTQKMRAFVTEKKVKIKVKWICSNILSSLAVIFITTENRTNWTEKKWFISSLTYRNNNNDNIGMFCGSSPTSAGSLCVVCTR